MMIRKRYTIEASAATLARFAHVVSEGDAFIQRVNPDLKDEFYYVTIIADKDTHTRLRKNRFTNFKIVPNRTTPRWK